MISIRRQLTRELLGSIFVLLSIGLGVLYFAARDGAIDQFDLALQAKARAISTLTSFDGTTVRVAFNDHFMPGFEEHKPRDFFQLCDTDGKEIARSESLQTGSQLPFRLGTLERPTLWNIVLTSGRPARAVGFRFKIRKPQSHSAEGEKELQLVVASDREELDETLWQLLGLCCAVSSLLVVATFNVVPRVLRRGLVSLDRLGHEATQINAQSLSNRFQINQFPAELQPIAQRLNDLLARLEDSFERERRFSADLAHELRTPLAELRAMAEFAIRWPESREANLDRDNLAITRQMERMVTYILALTRGEQEQIKVTAEPVALDVIFLEAWASFASRASERQLTVESHVSHCDVQTDPGLLRAILTNLFENAVEYTAQGGIIQLSIEDEPTGVTVKVANTVEDLTTEDLPKLFDRFWRKESARSGGVHLGLGLSLSRAFAQAIGWELSAHFSADRKVVFVLAGQKRPAAQAAPVNVD